MKRPVTTSFPPEITLWYKPQLFAREWVTGDLRERWYRRYKGDLICELDLSNARNQPHRHFGEWYTAVHYCRQGWKVLLPKYTHSSRRCRQLETARVVRSDGFNFLIRKRKLPDKQGSRWKLRKSPKPDLLIYRGDEFFFAEVKRAGDRLSPAQRAFFPMIEKKLNRRVVIVHVKEKTIKT